MFAVILTIYHLGCRSFTIFVHVIGYKPVAHHNSM